MVGINYVGPFSVSNSQVELSILANPAEPIDDAFVVLVEEARMMRVDASLRGVPIPVTAEGKIPPIGISKTHEIHMFPIVVDGDFTTFCFAATVTSEPSNGEPRLLWHRWNKEQGDWQLDAYPGMTDQNAIRMIDRISAVNSDRDGLRRMVVLDFPTFDVHSEPFEERLLVSVLTGIEDVEPLRAMIFLRYDGVNLHFDVQGS